MALVTSSRFFFGFFVQQQAEVKQKQYTGVHQYISAPLQSKKVPQFVQNFRKYGKYQKPAADSQKNQQVQSPEFLPVGNIQRGKQYHQSRNDQYDLQKRYVHKKIPLKISARIIRFFSALQFYFLKADNPRLW